MQGKIHYFENVETPQHQEFVAAQNQCVLCNNPLELVHTKVEEIYAIKEEASCPQCDLRNRRKVYPLQ